MHKCVSARVYHIENKNANKCAGRVSIASETLNFGSVRFASCLMMYAGWMSLFEVDGK